MATIETSNSSNAHRQPYDALRTASFVLVAIGIAITAYLSYVKLTDTNAVCIEGGAVSCEVVQNSSYSKLLGIPIVYLGLLAYLGLGALLVLENRIGLLRENGALIVFGITLFAFMFSAWLVYLQFFQLKALCPWCLGHELTMTILFIVSSIRLWKHMQA
jgi:uncharacterized membrane protein